MSGELRLDPLTGNWVSIVGNRQARPNLPATGCPFCVGGLEAPEPYDTKAFVNRWPAYAPGEPVDLAAAAATGRAAAVGAAEVILYSPVHDGSLGSLGVAQVRKVVDLWAERTAALGARPDVRYVLVFENRAPEVGATIAHPHGQIYAFDLVPPRARAELDRPPAAAAADATPPALGPDAAGDRLVSAADGWRAWVPWAANWPFEVVAAPDEQLPDLPALDEARRDGLAALLIDVLGRLDRLFDDVMPYMLWFHQRPTDGGEWPNAWLHVHIAPLYRSAHTQRFVAAGELGSQVYFNPVDPADAAARLREA